MEEVREFFEAVTRQLGSSSSSSRSSAENQANTSNNESGKKRKPKCLPSSFLKKAKVSGKKEQQWDKDIICLPKEYASCGGESEIPIPRGKKEKLNNLAMVTNVPDLCLGVVLILFYS